MPRLDFKGRSVVWNHHLAVPYRELIPRADKSVLHSSPTSIEGGEVSCSLNDNLIIHGDNLHALKALLPTYAGKVKCIYIDPPYNTGKGDWNYRDDLKSPITQQWLKETIDSEDPDRHEKWLTMMTPRLKILWELLSDDGVIFISIDDGEQHSLHLLLDAVFGESNFVSNIIWQKKYSPQNDAKYFSDMHDFILVYAKHKNNGSETVGWNRNLSPRTPKQDKRYKNPDNDPRGLWKTGGLDAKTYDPNYDYEITTPSGRIVKPPKGASWRLSKAKLAELISDNRIWFGKKGSNVPSTKIFLSEVQEGIVPVTIWFREEVGDNEFSSKEVKAIFPESDSPFKTPKPSTLIAHVIRLACDSDSIILDSFAGSGTTAHAVLALNKEDGGNRKFILVECEDYADSITAERVRRVIKGVPGAKDPNLKAGLGGTFSYFDLGDPIEVGTLLKAEKLPAFDELARYVFFTAVGEEINLAKVNQENGYLGSAREYDIYMLYRPEVEYLRSTALTLDYARSLPPHAGRTRVVFAPARYLSREFMDEYRVEFCQLPYELYRGLK